ncbi:MAG: Hsp70 family protein [Planctomycetota bacterium]
MAVDDHNSSVSNPSLSNAAGDPIVGIDLGTTNSLVAFCDERGPRTLAVDEAQGALLPSVVRFEADGSVVIGRAALDEAVRYPRTTIASAKRLMGRSRRDAEGDLRYLSYEVVEGEHNTARIAVPADGTTRIVSPQEVSALVLGELKRRAEAALGVAVRRAVVTVPAYFDDAQRQATRDAGRLAGLEVVRIVNEPTAAALAYGLGTDRAAERNAGPRTVAVYDLGGGTFDISILRLTPEQGEGGTEFFQVLSTAGDTRLGGDDIDHALVSLFVGEIRERLSMAADADPMAGFGADTRSALISFARGVKHALSDRETARVRIELNDKDVYEREVSRDELEAIMAPLVKRTIEACDRALRDAKRELDGGAIDAVVLVGGSTRIPLVRARVAERFGVEPYTALDPDRVVAMGAAVQAGILSGVVKGSLLLDVIPLSLGIKTAGGAVAKLIMRNSAVPARATEMFSTGVDGQVSIELDVVQGEREMASDCRSLGTFHLRGVPPMPAGVPQVEVEFLVDANGVLNVSATERRSGKRAGVQIVPNHGLTREEVDQMEADSITHAREDMTRHRVVDLITNSKLDLKWITERLERHADALESAYVADLEAKARALGLLIAEAEADWASVDANAFAQAKQSLDEASVRLQEVSIAASLRADTSS